ncbi:MAG: serine/threonine protein kinase [Candidatus Obscuribacterales bacterium]|nr:serine/threonine protein kinase [Candidatus Obscuribacterales bacterium]
MMLSPGDILLNKYRIVKVLGEGGMGTVYLARQIDLDRDVAIKVLRNSVDPDAMARFQREAKILSGLEHISIPSFYQFGNCPQSANQANLPFFVMELVSGSTLLSAVQSAGKFEAQKAIDIARQICQSMSVAHKAGVIHRDLGPANIMLCEKNQIKVMDFGLSSIQSSDQKLTNTGTLMGSPLYMSPEQCRGDKADERSDIYSLSCLLYFMLTGEPPFKADSPIAILRMHTHEEATPILRKLESSEKNKALSEVVKIGMSKYAKNRFQTMLDFDAALEAVENNEKIAFRSAKEANAKSISKRTGLVLIAASVLISTCLFKLQDKNDGAKVEKLNNNYVKNVIYTAEQAARKEDFTQLKKSLMQLDNRIKNEQAEQQIKYYRLLSRLQIEENNQDGARLSLEKALLLLAKHKQNPGITASVKGELAELLCARCVDLKDEEINKELLRARKLLEEAYVSYELSLLKHLGGESYHLCRLLALDAALDDKQAANRHKQILEKLISTLDSSDTPLENLTKRLLQHGAQCFEWGRISATSELLNQAAELNEKLLNGDLKLRHRKEIAMARYVLALSGYDKMEADHQYAVQGDYLRSSNPVRKYYAGVIRRLADAGKLPNADFVAADYAKRLKSEKIDDPELMKTLGEIISKPKESLSTGKKLSYSAAQSIRFDQAPRRNTHYDHRRA